MKKLHTILKEASKDIEVPFNVWRFFSNQCGRIYLAGNQASFGEDYGTLEELQEAVKWYAEQVGLEIKEDK